MMVGMAGYALGRVDGRATALTVILPLKWWGRAWLTVWFRYLRLPFMGRKAFRKLDRLRFVSAIRWSLLRPFVPRKSPFARTSDQRWQLLFESNFDGDWDEYLESFSTVTGKALRSIIRPGTGYPGLTTASLLKDYARIHDHTPHGYVSAYPTLTAGDIRQEILARHGPAAVRAIARRDFGRTTPRWSTFLLPISPGRTGAVTDATVALEKDVYDLEQQSVLLRTGAVHFVRVVVLDRPSGSWLLLTLTHDGPVEPILRQMIASDADATQAATGLLRSLFECVEGVPVPSMGWWDDATLMEFLLAHRPSSSNSFLAYCGYAGYTVGDIRSFVDERRRDERWPSEVALQ